MTTILLILRDAPHPDQRKGGLYGATIHHHVAAGFDVHVTSITPMEARHAQAVRDLGATPWLPEPLGLSPWIGGWRGLQRRLRGLPLRPAEWQTRPEARAHLADAIRPDFISGVQAYNTGLLARALALPLGVPYLTWEDISSYRRGLKLQADDATLRAFFRQAHVVAGVSTGVLDSIAHRFGLSLHNGRVIPNPVPTGFATPPGAPPDWLADFTRGRFLFAAWTNWRDIKRLDVLIEAFARVHAERPQTALFVAGPHDPAQDARVRALGLEGAVRMPGNIQRPEIWRLAHAADCCCIPSDYETFALPMIESLAAGRPVVATRTDGPLDVLSGHPELGELVPCGDADAMAEAMLRVHDNPTRFDPAAIAAFAEAGYGEAAQIARWRAVYAAPGALRAGASTLEAAGHR